MLHLAMHWPQQANASFWPQAMDYAIWVFNRMPNMESGISPNELWSSARGNAGIELSRAHVFGCPVYVLDAALQDGKKIPKWNPRARLGLFLGFSDLHSSQVPMVLNVETGKVSPQFHVIFDDKFETVHSLPTDEPITKQWAEILQLERECYMDIVGNKGTTVHFYVRDFSLRGTNCPLFLFLCFTFPLQMGKFD